MSIHDFAPLADHFPSSFLHPYHYPLDYSLRAFDPHPPHAGWTPKEEEVDDDEQSRHLLARTRSSPHLPAYTHHHTDHDPPHHQPSPAPTSKTYSFVSLPGNAVRKRPRRRYDEIERLYACAWPDCTKAYGTLNHLNAHVSMQRHGPKRSPAEFKELRKQWRQQKKQEAATASHIPDPQQRRRRTTDPSLPPHPLDMRFPAPHSTPSPTSSDSASANYWQDSPTEPSPFAPAYHHHPAPQPQPQPQHPQPPRVPTPQSLVRRSSYPEYPHHPEQRRST